MTLDPKIQKRFREKFKDITIARNKVFCGGEVEEFIAQLLQEQREEMKKQVDQVLDNLEYDGYDERKGHYFYETTILNIRNKILKSQHKTGERSE